MINGKKVPVPEPSPAGVIELHSAKESKHILDMEIGLRYVMHPNLAYVCELWGLKAFNNATWSGLIESSRVPAFIYTMKNYAPMFMHEELVGGSSRIGEPEKYLTGSRTKILELIEEFPFNIDSPAKWVEGEDDFRKREQDDDVRNHLYWQMLERSLRLRERNLPNGIVTYNFSRSRKKDHVKIWVKARTSIDMGPEANILNVKTSSNVAGVFRPAFKIPEILEDLSQRQILFYDSIKWFNKLEKKFSDKLMLTVVPDKPGVVDVWLGSKYPIMAKKNEKLRNVLQVTHESHTAVELKARVPLRTLTDANLEADNLVISESLEDIIRMSTSEPYLLDALDDNQQRVAGIHLATKKGLVNAAETGDGKGHPLWFPVLTPKGWVPIGELTTEDHVIGSDGKPTKVTGIYDRGIQNTCEAVFSDGTTVVCDEDHLWHLTDSLTENVHIVSTKEIMDSHMLTKGTFHVPIVKPVEYASEHSDYQHSNLLDPKDFAEFLVKMQGFVDIEVTEKYLRSDVDTRWKILNAFTGSQMDSTTSKTFSCVSPHENVSKFLTELIRSLGGYCEVVPIGKTRRETLKVQFGNFSARKMVMMVFHGEEETRCISVAAKDRLYVTDHFVVTHNTVTTLAAWEAKSHPQWLGLVICESKVKTQWANETAVWFPQAATFTLHSRKQTEELREWLENLEEPGCVITSYSLAGDAWVDEEQNEQMTELGKILSSHIYDDICVDEGLCLRLDSKTNKALKVLRNQAEVGAVLTATPFNTSKNDFAQLISFARNDYKMFDGVDLDELYDLNVPEQLEEWTKITYPVVQRDTVVDKSQFPDSETEVLYLNPTIEELELSAAITNSLKDILEDLIAASERVASSDKSTKQHAELVEELKTLRGTALGSMTLARQAASNPHCILESETLGAELIRNSSILDNIVEPTKQKKVVELVKTHVEQGDQIIVFSEFKTAASKLFDVLEEKGYRVGKLFGGQGQRSDQIVQQFRDGELDVVVATSAAKRGLNLQFCRVMIHMDLAWTPEGVLQRCGRIIRRFSPHKKVKFYYLVLDGTIDSRIMGVVAARTAEALLTSDAVSSSEMNLSRTALSVQSMLEQVDTSKVEITSSGDKTVRLVKELLSV